MTEQYLVSVQKKYQEKSGSIGIDLVIDEETANEQRVIHWKIEKRLVTPFELVEEA